MRFWIIYTLIQISFFGGTALGCFSLCFFLIFRHRPTMVADIFTQPLPPTHYNEASYAPANKAKRFAEYCNILFFRISTYLTHRYKLIFGNKGFVKSYETNELFRKKASQTVFFMKRRSLVLYWNLGMWYPSLISHHSSSHILQR